MFMELRMKVKICGITNRQDAEDAAQGGADALGFIFYSESPRYISLLNAGRIIRTLGATVLPVGVFVNAPREEVLRTIHETGIGCVQLHGEEDPEYTRGFPVPVWKAFRVGSKFNEDELRRYHVGAYLLDAHVEGWRGGTGRTFDWEIACRAKRFGNIVLSGGITPENVVDAVRTVRPYAIDISSGVEISPGRKDRQKLLQLFANIRTIEG
jgi:phosphoribosylanthranilate isomerase